MSAYLLAQQAHAVQLALHLAITGDPGVQSALGNPVRAFDDPPSAPVFPYLTYGAVRSEDTSGDGAPQGTHRIDLSVWSRDQGRGEVLELMRLIQDAAERELPHIVLPLFLDVVRAPDGRGFRGLLRLSVISSDSSSIPGDAP